MSEAVLNDIEAFGFALPYAGGSQLPCCKDPPKAPWKNPCGEELNPPSNGQHKYSMLVSHRGSGYFNPSKASDDCSLANVLMNLYLKFSSCFKLISVS